MAELWDLSLADVAARYRDGTLQPGTYVQSLIARIHRYDSQVNSVLRLDETAVLQQAAAADAALETARSTNKDLPPLFGIPIGLKDIIDQKDVPTTAHSALRAAANGAKADAAVTARLRDAGALFPAKLATHEFALGGPSFDLPWPPARNPWNPAHSPGGSSSGSGAAVAAGFMPAALGTDTGGSVRNPASSCGLVGMKATYGRVSRRGVVPLSYSLDHVGPLTRTVRDNALMLNVIAGYDPEDDSTVNMPVPDYTAALNGDIRGLRLGVIRHFYEDDLEADPDVRKAIDDAIVLLAELGCRIETVSTAPLQEFQTCNRVILLGEAYSLHGDALRQHPEKFGALARQRLVGGAFYSAEDYVTALKLRRLLRGRMQACMQGFDAIVTASNMAPPFPIDDAEAAEREYPRHARTPFNVTGHPALVLPIGFTENGLPLSMQFVAHEFMEATLYRLASAYENATDWHQRRPPLGDA